MKIISHFFTTITIITISFLEYAYTIQGFNKTESNQCLSINPKTADDCLKSGEYKSLICCYYNMEQPLSGSVCVPMYESSKGLRKDNLNSKIPINIVLKGSYSCSSGYIASKYIFSVIYLVIFLFLSI